MKAVVYLLQVSACSAIFYLFYFLLLRKLTFFTLNRWFLLTTVLLSFLIPAISLPVDRGQPHIVIVQQAVNVNTLQFSSAEKTIVRVKTAPKTFDYLLFLRVIYWIVVIGLSVKLIVTLIRFFRKLKGKQTVKSGRINIIQSQSEFPNGSFLNYIFLNGQDLSADELQQIITHEMLHVQLAHSVDRVLIKIAQILLWFNPFIYFYAKSAEENHEFEVDRALTNATDKRSYANLLLHLSVAGGGTLYHSFSKVPLKKRIAMLFNQPSAKMKKVIYVLILPVVLISCLAFAKLKSNKTDNKYLKKTEKADKSPMVLKDQFYTRLRLKDGKGRDYDKVIVQTKENNGRSTYSNIKVDGKAVFLIDKKPYTEEQIKNMPGSVIAKLFLDGSFFGKKQAAFPADIARYNAIFILHTKKSADTTKYRQKLKRTPEQIKGKADKIPNHPFLFEVKKGHRFPEPFKLKDQDKKSTFKVTKLSYLAPKNILTQLKNDQNNSYVSVGKIINMNTFQKEQDRVFKFLSAMFPNVEKKHIIFKVDTTQQKNACTVIMDVWFGK
ncbi:M56 family metallopeptidase [Mucilaginibacter sp.]|uniref:M56 family metallopeptidase n=1 Tax=Mucilaginibacter sp. TaxID=1882438 RepID=UPI003AFFAC5A